MAVIIGTFGADNLVGTNDDDQIFGLPGNDTISGEPGNDIIDGGLGNDNITGGTGNDTISGGFGNDTIDGGGGEDTIGGGAGNDNITGGDDNDAIAGDIGNDTINGGGGNDTIFGDDLLGLLSGTDTISGGDGDDTIFGGGGGDTIFGNDGNDTIFGDNLLGFPSGADTISGGNGDDTIFGGGSDDTISGDNGDDQLIGSTGSDTFDGGMGTDTADYSELGAAITLLSQGKIEKEGIGEDTITNTEVIIGDANFINTIDGSTAAVGNAAFDIDLALNKFNLVIKSNPNIVVPFTVQNFQNVVGTKNNDIIRGNALDNTFFGSLGRDILDGSVGGFNTVDYSDLAVDITLAAGGVIKKDGGAKGFDTIGDQFGRQTIQKIIGSDTGTNLIDGTAPAGETVAFDVDLDAETLNINLPFGTVEFQVVGFTEVKGTQNSDTITGNSSDNIFFSSTGNDTYNGGSGGFDTIDYSDLGAAITLASGGLITKGAGKGTDNFTFGPGPNLVQTIDRIVGAAGFTNAIVGNLRTPGDNGAKLDVDLTAQTLKVTFEDNLSFGGVNIVPGDTLNFVVENFVNVTGGANNDTIKGDAANNTFFGSGGNDTLDGAGGFNTVDYSALDDKITLKVGGSIDKGANGIDQIGGPGFTQTIQKIIGATGQTNAIDGTGSVSTVSFNVDLSTNNLTVRDIFGPGSNASFVVEKFVNVVGTAGNDTIKGDAANNTFFGSGGNDTLDGADGFNTIDYSALNDKITLKVGGSIDKGTNGVDRIGGPGSTQTIQKIVGATGKDNAIDGTGSVGSVAFNVNLDNDSLQITNLPGLGTVNFVVDNFVNVTGTNSNDVITGDAANNTFFGSTGNDTYNGGSAGTDTIDYSGLGAAVTLSSGGLVIKGAGKGTDNFTFGAGPTLVQTIENVVGAVGFANAINGSPLTSDAKIDVDLTAQTLKVTFLNSLNFGGTNIVPGDALNFGVTNFVNVTGSANNDTIKGDAANNTFFGSRGNDTLDGAGGINTIDYSALDDKITLKVGGSIDKGTNGVDQIGGPGSTQTIQKIVGATGKDNAIDGTGSVGNVRFTVNLAKNTLAVAQLPGIGTANFTVEKFVDVTGTNANDTITGSTVANVLDGGNGNDTLVGGNGNDTLVGGNGNDKLTGGSGNDILNGVGSSLGATDLDTLNGGAGADTFILGNAASKFYIGTGRATLTNFTTNLDKIQLNGAANNYTFVGNNLILFGSDVIASLSSGGAFNTATDFIFV